MSNNISEEEKKIVMAKPQQLIFGGYNCLCFANNYIINNLQITHLDLSNNLLQSGMDFSNFPNLRTLILDNNKFNSLLDFAPLAFLDTLSLMKNEIFDLK